MEKIRVTLVLRHSDINRIIKASLEFTLNEKESIIDVIKLADEEILKKAGTFPVKGYKSLSYGVSPYRKQVLRAGRHSRLYPTKLLSECQRKSKDPSP